VRTGFLFAPNAKFLLHAGDLVNGGVPDAEWGEVAPRAGLVPI